MPRAARFTVATKTARVTLSAPILPHGVTWEVEVPAGKLPEATKALLKLWAPLEDQFKRLPVPGPDTVPGGTPVDPPDDEGYWERLVDTPPPVVGFVK